MLTPYVLQLYEGKEEKKTDKGGRVAEQSQSKTKRKREEEDEAAVWETLHLLQTRPQTD